MAYTGHSEVAEIEPATFVVVGDQDGIAPPAAMRRRVETLRRSGTAVEYHEYKGVGHGFGLGTGTSADGWVCEAIRFWEEHMARHRPGASDGAAKEREDARENELATAFDVVKQVGRALNEVELANAAWS
jgi:acetyl esterase/lipase